MPYNNQPNNGQQGNFQQPNNAPQGFGQQANFQQPNNGQQGFPQQNGFQQPPQGQGFGQSAPNQNYGNQGQNFQGQAPQGQQNANRTYPHFNAVNRYGRIPDPNNPGQFKSGVLPMEEWTMVIEGFAKSMTVRTVNTSSGPKQVVDLQISSVMQPNTISFLFGDEYLSQYNTVMFRVSCWDREGEFILKYPPQKNQRMLVMVTRLTKNEFTGQNNMVYRSIQCRAVGTPRKNSKTLPDHQTLVPEYRTSGENQQQNGFQQPPQNFGQQGFAQQGNYQQPNNGQQAPNGFSAPNGQNSGLPASFNAFQEIPDSGDPFGDEELPF